MRRIVALSLLAGIAIIGVLAYDDPRVQWRASLTVSKLRGELPWLGWEDLLSGFLPTQWRHGYNPDPDIDITLKRTGDEACPALWQTTVGSFWAPNESRAEVAWPIHEQVDKRVYEKDLVIIQPGDVVLDVGSHLGTFTRRALQLGAAQVVAFEIGPGSIACFSKTFEEEIAAGKVRLVQAAAWEEAGTLELRGSGMGGTVMPFASGEHTSLSVPATTIDLQVRELGLERVDFIKMDIEGSERHALKGARETISRFRPRLAICAYHRWDDVLAVPQTIWGISPGYQILNRRTEQLYFYHP